MNDPHDQRYHGVVGKRAQSRPGLSLLSDIHCAGNPAETERA
jgi:hypothetical protein